MVIDRDLIDQSSSAVAKSNPDLSHRLRIQGEHVSSSAKPNLSARPNVAQRIDRMGGGSGSARDSQQRSWVVLGIGVGAIGSFLAAVAFAVGQYQKVRISCGRCGEVEVGACS